MKTPRGALIGIIILTTNPIGSILASPFRPQQKASLKSPSEESHNDINSAQHHQNPSSPIITNPPPRLADLPNHVSENAIDKLVHEILKDPSINIRAIPDPIEAVLYRTTVRLTLNAIYRQIISLNGRRSFLGQTLKMSYYPETTGKTAVFSEAGGRSRVDVGVLEEVADRLLQNRNINQRLVPDVLERQVYTNCLKVVFRVLEILQHSLRIDFCGHSLGLELGPQQHLRQRRSGSTAVVADSTLRSAAEAVSNASREEMERFRRESEVFVLEDGGGKEEGFKWWLFLGRRRAMLSQVHAALFGFVVNIVQVVIHDSVLEFAGVGRIVMDLVPSRLATDDPEEGPVGGDVNGVRMVGNNTVSLRRREVATRRVFLSGVGTGALVFLLVSSLREGDWKLGQRLQSLNSWTCKIGSPIKRFTTARTRKRVDTADGDVSSSKGKAHETKKRSSGDKRADGGMPNSKDKEHATTTAKRFSFWRWGRPK